MEDKGPIDLVRYGVLWNKIENYEQKFSSMEKKIDDMESDLKKLVLMAERSKGGIFVGMAVISVLSSAVGYITHWFAK
jgi:hypothetical protein